jgi:uncharacterized protein (TIGR02145 family)
MNIGNTLIKILRSLELLEQCNCDNSFPDIGVRITIIDNQVTEILQILESGAIVGPQGEPGVNGVNGGDGRSFYILGTIHENITVSQMSEYLPPNYVPEIGHGWLVGSESNLYYWGEYENETEEWVTGWINYGSLIGLQGPPGLSGQDGVCPENCGDTENLTEVTNILDSDTLTLWRLQNLSVNFGFLYNFYAASDARNISSSHKGYEVPVNGAGAGDLQTLVDYVGGSAIAGKKLKSSDPTKWHSTGVGTDDYGFSAIGSGLRREQNFTGLKFSFNGWTKTPMSSSLARSLWIQWNNDYVYITNSQKWWGRSVRLVRLATTEELILADGTILVDDYIGNDLSKYDGVKIGTQIWTKTNIAETKYANGDLIPNDILSIEDWANLTTGALCAYDDNIDYVFDGVDENIPHKLTIETLREEFGGIGKIQEATDVDVTDIADGKILVAKAITGGFKHVYENKPSGGGGIFIRRSFFVPPFTSYRGFAPENSLETDAVWTITKTIENANGTIFSNEQVFNHKWTEINTI